MKTISTLLIGLFFAIAANSQTPCSNYWVAVSPDGNYLYFSSNRTGDYEIYRSDIDGVSNLMRLTNMSGNDLFPSLSPDGSKIVFQNGDYGSTTEIYMMNNDGSGLTRLTNNSSYDGNPSYHPNGQSLVFSAWDGSQYPEIFTMNLDGSNRTQLTDRSGADWASAPQYNPTGTKIYFEDGFNADNHIVMMNTDGSNWVDITPSNDFGYTDNYFSFSPDGSEIIFFNSDNHGYNNGGDLVIANADGSNWNRITNAVSGEYYYQAVYHPSNGQLLYTHISTSSVTNIFRMNQDGTNSVELTNCALVTVEEKSNFSNFTLYPNPAQGMVKFSHPGAEENMTLSIYDAIGNKVMERQVNKDATNMDINLEGWANGVYFCQIVVGENTTTRKLIVANK